MIPGQICLPHLAFDRRLTSRTAPSRLVRRAIRSENYEIIHCNASSFDSFVTGDEYVISPRMLSPEAILAIWSQRRSFVLQVKSSASTERWLFLWSLLINNILSLNGFRVHRPRSQGDVAPKTRVVAATDANG